MDVSGRCRKRGHAEGGDGGGFEWLRNRARTSSRRGGVLGVKVREGLEARDDLGVVHPRLEDLLDLSRETGRERHSACVDDARGVVPVAAEGRILFGRVGSGPRIEVRIMLNESRVPL